MLIFVMIVFTAFYTAFADRQIAVQQHQASLTAEEIANDAVFEIRMALLQGDGYSRNFTLPGELRGNEYSIDIVDGTLVVSWDGRNLYRDAIVDTVNGDIVPGENRISNQEGELYVE